MRIDFCPTSDKQQNLNIIERVSNLIGTGQISLEPIEITSNKRKIIK